VLTNPERINLPQETLGLRRAGFSPALSLLMSAYSLPFRPTVLTVDLLPTMECSPTPPTQNAESHSFGNVLEPRYIFGADALDQ
jgi:hypothetical protein